MAYAAVLAGLAGQPTPSLVGERVSGPSFDGVIVAFTGKSGKGESAAELWMPTAADVRQLEAALPAYAVPQLKRFGVTKRLGDYKRQYVGFVKGGQREIVVQFYHRTTDLVKSGKWLWQIVSVAGGGDDYLRAWYSVDKKRFTDFSVNAPE